MLDANGTRHHLLLGEADWKRCDQAFDAAAPAAAWQPLDTQQRGALEWQDDWQVVRLQALPFRFPPPVLDDMPDFAGQRRSAAADQFGNWYWIDSSSQRLRVWSEGTTATDFWPPATNLDAQPASGFQPASRAMPEQVLQLAGVVVSSDHFLIVGTLAPAGVLVFDLAAGGAPIQLLWPPGQPYSPFVPFDMAAGPAGSVWILDRDHRRCWVLDRRFGIITSARTGWPSAPGEFAPVAGGGASVSPSPASTRGGTAIELDDATDPVAIEVLKDGTLLVLDRHAAAGQPSRLLVYRDGLRLDLKMAGGEVVDGLTLQVDVAAAAGSESLPLAAYDFAVVPSGDSALPVDIFVVQQDGNQAYVFSLAQTAGERWVFRQSPGYRPMRRFGGRGLVALNGLPYYDFAESWMPLVEEARPRHEQHGALRTPVFDGREPECVWHRLMLDACIPSEAGVIVWTRCANDRELLAEMSWSAEPQAYLRGDGSEIPFLRTPWPGEPARGEGTWELLFQNARGRYLQIMIELTGNQRATPSLRALRAYYPRFSYLTEYLPTLYRDDAASAHFLDGFLANLEGFHTAIEDRIANVQVLFDPTASPAAALEWLAEWFGAVLDPSWDDARRRLFIRHAMLLFNYRGTIHGVRLALALALEAKPEEVLFAPPGTIDERRFGVRMIEKYLARRLPDVLLGDPNQLQADSLLNPTVPWQLAEGGAALGMRYAQALGLGQPATSGIELPLVAPDDTIQAEKWALFCEIHLGFTPFAGALECAAWQAAVIAEYAEIETCNEAWRTGYATFKNITQPADMPAGEQGTLWTNFMRQPDPRRTPIERRQWQAFLRARYGTIASLNAVLRTHWPDFDLVPLPDRLPADGSGLQDWLQFEGGVLAIRDAAHRFSVLLPMPTGPGTDPEAAHRRLELARRIVTLEKPAHTTFDVRFYWAMFRVGEARLGIDTRIDTNLREQLIPPLVLGRGYLGAALLAPNIAVERGDRRVLGRDRIIH